MRASIVLSSGVRLLFLGVVLFVTQGTPANFVEHALANLLREVEPRVSFSFSKTRPGVGTVIEDGSEIAFELVGKTVVLGSGADCAVGILTFPSVGEQVTRGLLENGVLTAPNFHSRVFSAVFLPDSTTVVSRLLDERAMSLSVERMVVGELLGEGAKQVQIWGTAVYAFESPIEEIVAQRQFLYDVPTLDVRAELTTQRMITGLDYIEANNFFSQSVKIIPKTATEPAQIQITSDSKAKTYSLGKGAAHTHPPDRPWERDSERVARRKAHLAPRNLCIQVLNGAEEAMIGASVSGAQTQATMAFTSRSFPFQGVTDGEGKFIVSVSRQLVDLEVRVPEYYASSLRYKRTEVPTDCVTVRLERQDAPVVLRDNSGDRMRYEWTTGSQAYEIGLTFGKGEAWNDKGQWTTDRASSDIWFAARRVDDLELGVLPNSSNTAAWEIFVSGVRGWEIQRGPDVELPKNMRRAPTEGYQAKEVFRGEEHNNRRNYYLRKDGGALYGKLVMVNFADWSTKDAFRRQLSTWYAVQAESVGSPSLNPTGH